MKLIIQIPCLNEEATIGATIAALPRHVEGIDAVEILVVDDGSTDRSADVARQAGATEVLSLPRHMGLAQAFNAGVQRALARGADILVNTDADHQYPSDQIGGLVSPILEKRADIVIGDRLSMRPAPFGPVKMAFERLGSLFVRIMAGVAVRDAASGFRAFSRDALERLYIHGSYSYTMESLVAAGLLKLRVVNVPITTNSVKRASRLVHSIPGYIARSVTATVRAYLMYRPLAFFVSMGGVCIAAALVVGLRFLYYYLRDGGGGHIQSLILLAVLAMAGFQCVVLGLIGDVIAANRRLIEELRRRPGREGTA